MGQCLSCWGLGQPGWRNIKGKIFPGLGLIFQQKQDCEDSCPAEPRTMKLRQQQLQLLPVEENRG